jgi:hypothetical protein
MCYIILEMIYIIHTFLECKPHPRPLSDGRKNGRILPSPSERRAVKFYVLKSLSTGEGFRVRLK